MSIAIVTDSTCDLPQTVVDQHRIHVVPMVVNIGQASYLDGVELSRQTFYEGLPTNATPPTTSVPSPGDFRRVYEGLAADGIREVLSVHIATSLSAVVNSARLGAADLDAPAITVIDSRQLTLGLGFLALAAAKAAEAGRSLAEIVELVENQIRRTHVFAALDTLEFLRRSGRVSGLAAGFGELLSVKPLLKMYDGEAKTERVRTRSRALQRLIDLVRAVGPLDRLALVHTNARERALALGDQARDLFLDESDPLCVEVTSVIGAHIGPGVVGFVAVGAESG
jgi:DegV family protein with EDD domain